MKKLMAILIGFLLAYLLAACSSNDIAPAITATAPSPDTPTPELAGEPVSGSVELVLSITGDPNPLSSPSDLELDRQGNLYVVDSFNNGIQKFDRNGQFLTMWGTSGQGDGEFNLMVPDVGAGAGAVAVDESGNVYVADWGNHRIQKFDSNGQFLAKWGTRGSSDGQFLSLVSVAVDRKGYVYVLDDAHADIQKFDGNGQFLTQWGSSGKGDGQFNFIAGEYGIGLGG